MLAMTIGTNNWEEEMTVMKAMLEKLIKENKDKEVHIQLQEKKITRLAKKLKKWSARSFMQNSESENEEKVFVQSEPSDEEVHSKKGGQLKTNRSSGLMTSEQI